MWKSIRNLVRSTLRYKLFAVAVLPTVLAGIATLGFTIYWFNSFTRDNLLMKARGDVALAQDTLKQVAQERYLGKLQLLASSYDFRALLARGDTAGLRNALERMKREDGFDFVHITGELGNWLYEDNARVNGSSKPSPLTSRAARGEPATALEVFNREDLLREGEALSERGRGQLADTDAASEIERLVGRRAMMLRVACPITDRSGKVTAVLDGGVLLNRNVDIVNAVRDRVYRPGTLPQGGAGVVALFLDDTRIASDFPAAPNEPLSGMRVPPDLRNNVLGQGQLTLRRDAVGEEWYISAYAPLFDADGQAVGMLYAGLLEAPFRHAYYRAAALLLLIFLVLIGVAGWIAARGARSVFAPIERITAVVRATQAGIDRRIGKIDCQDEVRELATQFDAMLDLLGQHNRAIQKAAEQLEAKVEERTRELEAKNADLEATVDLLHKTRRQLVMTEKLAALGELAAGIAHEINNPTAVVLGNLDILAAELGSAADPVRAEINLIAEQVERIRHIVNRLLQFARPVPANGVTDVDVNKAVESALPLVRHIIDKKSIVLHKRLNARRTVCANQFELEEVLVNLVINAARAVGERGTIEVATADWDQRGAVLSVRDNGVGIAPDKLKRIFDPFFTTDPKHSTGLGLSVSYGLVRRYGGNITVKSELGTGSVFHVWMLSQPAVGLPGQVAGSSAPA